MKETYLLQLTTGEYVSSPTHKTTSNANFAASFSKAEAEAAREALELTHGSLQVVLHQFKSFLS